MKIYTLIGLTIWLLVSCTEKKEKYPIPDNFNKLILGDWIVRNQSKDRFSLARADRSPMDSSRIFRFREQQYFVSFVYFDSPRKQDGQIMETNDAYSNWKIDLSTGTLVINEYKESVTQYERKVVSYAVSVISTDSIILIKNKVIKTETGFPGTPSKR